MLGERSVGEIDDIHVEMDDVIAETLGEELEGAAGSPLRILFDIFQPDAASFSRPISPRSNLVEWYGSWANSRTWSGSSIGRSHAADAKTGSDPSTPSMWARAIQSSAPSSALCGVFRSECRSKDARATRPIAR